MNAAESDLIVRLSSVIRPLRSRGSASYIFLGWNAQAKPRVSADRGQLSPEARGSFEAYQISGAQFPAADVDASLRAYNYKSIGQAVSYESQPQTRAQAIVTCVAEDGKGDPVNLSIPELTLLKTLLEARVPWQDKSVETVDEVTGDIAAKDMYTLLFAPRQIPLANPLSAGPSFALLFRPDAEGAANAETFRGFVVQVLDKLLRMDQRARPEDRKGYAQAAARYVRQVGVSKVPGFVRLLEFLGLLEIQVDEKPRPRSILEKLGLVEPDEASRAARARYDFEAFDLQQLFTLTELMVRAALSGRRAWPR